MKKSGPAKRLRQEAVQQTRKPTLAVVGTLFLLVAAAGLGLWTRTGSQPDTSPRSRQESSRAATVEFEDIAASANVEFVLNNSSTDDKPIVDSVLGGLSALDYDRDGWVDLFFTNGASLPDFQKSAPRFWNRLYRNRGDETFEDVTEKAGVRGKGYSMGSAAGDYDNDGFPDLYVSGYDANILYRNRGDGTFEDVTDRAGTSGSSLTTSSSGSAKKPWSVAALWIDYDVDGFLDLFVVNYLDWSFANNQVCGDPGRRLSCAPDLYEGTHSILYRNRGDGTFEDVSVVTGLNKFVGKGMSAASADFDHDGYPDIFVSNDGMRDFLFHNQMGETFLEIAVETGVALNEDGVPTSSMGAVWQDCNNDGWADIFVTALTNETYPLFVNRAGERFADSTFSSGIGRMTTTLSGWGVSIVDLDNDGHKDIFTANSHVSENVEAYRGVPYEQTNRAFRNLGDETFQAVEWQSAPAAHRGLAVADFNNDGRMDVAVSSIGKRAELLMNRTEPRKNWILINLVGETSNRMAIGARVRLETPDGAAQYRSVGAAQGYASSSDHRVHFGLSDNPTIAHVEITWPNGAKQVLTDVASNQVLRVNEGGKQSEDGR